MRKQKFSTSRKELVRDQLAEVASRLGGLSPVEADWNQTVLKRFQDGSPTNEGEGPYDFGEYDQW